MGRTSKFSFPMPGRKYASNKENSPSKPPSTASNNLSKAQRILGTDSDLNIDSPARGEEHSWRYPGSRSSGMSISISESTQSTNESGSIDESQSDQWDHESGVFPGDLRLRGKASSTVLGQKFGEDGATTNSGGSGRLRNEDSSSTLRSYYDRQKSPLSISQQTSASSTRDLALRKGFPSVVQRSPLLQVESIDPFDQHFAGKSPYIRENDYHVGTSPADRESRKKPARLDLSMLFPKSRKYGNKSSDGDSLTRSPSSISPNASRTPDSQAPKKLKKKASKDSIQSQRPSIRSSHSHDGKQRQANGALDQLYNHYEHLPTRSPQMDRIPEARVPDLPHSKINRDHQGDQFEPRSQSVTNREPHPSPSNKDNFSWKNVRASLASPPWESSSAASISSRNTKTSRHTSASLISNTDLKQQSVLSLSSDSGEEDSDLEPMKSPVRSPSMSSNRNKAYSVLSGQNNTTKNTRYHSSQQFDVLTTGSQGHRKGAAKGTAFLTIPETSSATARLSGPWAPPKTEILHASSRQKDRRTSSQKEKKSSKKAPSITSVRSSRQQPTPPLSPTSVEFRQCSERSSRFMAVTKQEEALLEALRQKRARMKEEIIEEHIAKSPPRIPERNASRYSTSSSVNTVRGVQDPTDRHRALLYLDTPISDSRSIDTQEPSPDLSDFLSFGSDEDSTPRNSWIPGGKGHARLRGDKFSPMTPPSAARLSAVGAIGGFRDDPSTGQVLATKKRNNGVRFVDDAKLVGAQDFLLDESENGVIWNM